MRAITCVRSSRTWQKIEASAAINIMTQCDDIAQLLGAFQDGELPAHGMREVARHLAGCKGCEEAAESYSAIGRMLRDAAPAPDLEGFAGAVLARLDNLRPSLLTRFGHWLDVRRERFGVVTAMAFAAAAAAVTIAIATPFAHYMMSAGNRAAQIAARDVHVVAQQAANAPAALASAAGSEPGVIISKLETSNPDVAVWSEPTQGTTVIWLPDQQP
ncbi:MAG TPA: zf-HC2 domain-containing protein [Candidatus Binataceae bacterium]|nr:zf-HC2 domain-containing protein [Candidatus Binataceae bacterium]